MEDTLKSAGVNTMERHDSHFDNLEKAQLGGFDNPDAVDGADYFAGQVRGRGQEGWFTFHWCNQRNHLNRW